MFSLTDYEWLSTGQIVSLRGRSYAHGPSDVPLLGETIGESLRRTAERFGESDALVVPHQGYRATYDELWEEVEAAARALIAHGVDRGDRVGIWAAQSPRMDRDAVRSGTHWRDPCPDRPDVHARGACLHPHQGGRERARHGARVPGCGLPGDARRRALELLLAARDDRPGGRLGGAPVGCRVRLRRRARGARGEPPVRRPGRDPVHVGHDRPRRRA